jgi:hypothetical protein
MIRKHSPIAVVYPVDYEQVRRSLLCATSFGVQPIPRSGGNSFEAFSTADGAVVIDISEMDRVDVDLDAMTATVQLGIRMGNLYTKVYEAGRVSGKNLTVVAGVHRMVGLGGVTAAGGYGSTSRKHGTAADNILSITVMDYTGQILIANDTYHDDLFFALRGGGGGTFGIGLEATLKVYDTPETTVATVVWPNLDFAVDVMDVWQRWAPFAPEELTFTFNLLQRSIQLNMYHLGTKEEFLNVFEKSGLLEVGFPTINTTNCNVLQSRAWLTLGGSFGCDGVITFPKRTPPETRQSGKYKSEYFSTFIPREGLTMFKDMISRPGGFFRLIQLKSYGGIFDRIPTGYNAYPHRKGTLFHAEIGVGLTNNMSLVPVPETAPAWIWVKDITQKVQPYTNGMKYNGYVSLDDTIESYFGTNFRRLQEIKTKYDPKNIFRNPLSVPPL